MDFGLLGPVRARSEGQQLPVAGRQRVLLALLLIDVGHAVSADRLIEALWGHDLPRNPTNALQVRISQLRKVVDVERRDDLLVARGNGYALEVDTDCVDAHRFEQLVAQGRALLDVDPAGAAAALADGLALWRGDAIVEFAHEPWAMAEARRLDECRLAATEDRLRAELALGRHAAVVAELEDLARTHPLRERLRAQLMLALYRSGRQADALQAFHDGRELLADELGIDPGPELRDLESRILQQDPALLVHPRTLGTVAAADDVPTALPNARARLVGREEEIRSLAELWAEARAGQPRLVTVTGEAGIGKTTLVEEFVAAHIPRDAAVHWGRCLDTDGTPAYWPWIQVLRTLIDDLPAGDVPVVVADGAGIVAQLAPDLRPRLGSAPRPPVAPDSGARFHLYEAVSRVLTRAAQRQPLVLVLEDVHWADTASLELLRVLAAQMRSVPLLVLVTHREHEPGGSPSFSPTMAALVREPIARRLPVSRLLADDVSEITQTHLRTEVSRSLAVALCERTDGNPFFLTELLTLAETTGTTGRLVVPEGVPWSVREVIGQRVGLLPDDTRTALAAGAVAGRDFRTTVVGATLGWNAPALLEALEPAVQARIVVPGEQLSAHRFVHALVQQTIYELLPNVRRAQLHAAVGEALELLGDDRDLSIVADHYLHAAALGKAEDAVDRAVRASEQAIRMLAFSSAEGLLVRALGVLRDHLADPQRELRVQARLAFLLRQTEGWTSERVQEATARVRVLAHDLADAPEVAGALWATCAYLVVGADFDAGLRVAEELSAAGDRQHDRCALAAGLQARATIACHLGRPHESARLSTDAIVLVDQLALDELEQRGLLHMATAARCNTVHPYWLLGRAAEAEANVRRAMAIADERNVAFDRAYSRAFMAWLAALRQDAPTAMACGSEAVELSREHGFTQIEVLGGVPAGWGRAAGGDAAAGAHAIRDSLELADGTGMRMLQPLHRHLLADALRRAGDERAALGAIDDGIAASERYGEHFHLAELFRAKGELLSQMEGAEAGRRWLDAAVETADRQGAVVARDRAESAGGRPRAVTPASGSEFGVAGPQER